MRTGPFLIAIGAASAAAFYFVGLATGAVTLVGYEQRSTEGRGFVRDDTGIQTKFTGMPVWLPAGHAVRADYEVDAPFGSLAVSVAPPLFLRTSLQAATAYVEGRRSGSILFIAKEPGWYRFRTDASPIGGPRCRGPNTTMLDVMIGSAECPSYRVRYTVSWHLAGDAAAARSDTRLVIPAPNERLAVTHIR